MSPSQSSMWCYQLISVITAVGRVHLSCCEISWRGSVCVQHSCEEGGECCQWCHTLIGVQLGNEAAEAVMSRLSIFIFTLGMRQIHRITVHVCWELVGG